jgi:hypothetical protein
MLAYPDPWDSPLGWQLAPQQRELVALALNSALLEAAGGAAKSPLEVSLGHAKRLVRRNRSISFSPLSPPSLFPIILSCPSPC